MAMLRAIARMWGIEPVSNVRTEMVDQLSAELLRPESVARILGELSPQERGALEEVIAAGGRIKAHPFALWHGPIRPLGPGRLEREEPWQEPASPAESLWYRGLIYKAFDEEEGQVSEFVLIPSDLLPLLPQVKKRPDFTVEKAPIPPSTHPGELSLVEDVFNLLSYLQNHEMKPRSDGSLPPRDIERLNERLLVRETGRFAFLHHLCQRMELIQVQEGLLKPNPTPAKQWLKSPRWRQIEALQEAWRDDSSWNELWRMEGLECEDTGWRNDPLMARKKILGYLVRCPPGEWLSLTSFVQAIKEVDPDFQRPDGDYDSWYIRQADTDEYLLGFQHWDEVEGALIIHLIAKPLHWLGMTSLGYTEDELSSFLITPWGAAFLGLPHKEPKKETQTPLIVKPNFTVLFPATGSLYDRFQLERFATLVESKPDLKVYRLEQRSLARGLRQGIKIDMILGFLRRASRSSLPRNVALALRNWARKYGKVRLRSVVLLEAEDEFTLQELETLPQTKRYLLEVISKRSALVAREDWPKLLAELKKIGYLSKIEGLGDTGGRK